MVDLGVAIYWDKRTRRFDGLVVSGLEGFKRASFGSFLFGDSHGDLNTLMESFSLSREVIVQLYGGLALFSLSLVLAHYFTLGVLGFGDSSQEDEAKGF